MIRKKINRRAFPRGYRHRTRGAWAGLPKRSLQDRFFRHLGCTVFEQTHRKRIDHAKQLLRGADNKTAFIAEDSGFGPRERFRKAIKQATGTNPAEYRAAQMQKVNKGKAKVA